MHEYTCSILFVCLMLEYIKTNQTSLMRDFKSLSLLRQPCMRKMART